jgi:hypothetical protein
MTREYPQVFVNACDYSSSAIEVLKSQPAYSDSEDSARVNAFVYDLSSTDSSGPAEIEDGSIDIISCVFVLSGIGLFSHTRSSSSRSVETSHRKYVSPSQTWRDYRNERLWPA